MKNRSDIWKSLINKIVFAGFLCLFFILIDGCASTSRSTAYDKKAGLLMLKNTEMSMNKKYYSRHNQKTKRNSYKRSRR